MGRIPLSVRKPCQNDVGHLHHPKTDDWHVEVAVPRTYSEVKFHNEEFESSSVTITKPLETVSADITSMQDVDYDYVPTDDKHECSSVSNYETKFLTSHDCFVNNGRQKPIVRSQQFGEEISCNEQMYSIKMQNPRSSDSTVTESSPQITHQCCVLRANEMLCIQNQLSDIEIKQANMMHQLQIYTAFYSLEKSLGLDPNDPIIPFVVFVGSSETLWAIYWLWKYGGYSGDLSPKSAFELLSGDSNAVLIDVRFEASYGQFFSAIFKNDSPSINLVQEGT
ncbi:calcium sensing receptor, chloroplastic [Trifolium repens]|nr:calcium sensing receptor, chloroplastic [Trifolium repens]